MKMAKLNKKSSMLKRQKHKQGYQLGEVLLLGFKNKKTLPQGLQGDQLLLLEPKRLKNKNSQLKKKNLQ